MLEQIILLSLLVVSNWIPPNFNCPQSKGYLLAIRALDNTLNKIEGKLYHFLAIQ